jgi:hypothetical protein
MKVAASEKGLEGEERGVGEVFFLTAKSAGSGVIQDRRHAGSGRGEERNLALCR